MLMPVLVVPHGSSHPRQGLPAAAGAREAAHDGGQVAAKGGHGAEPTVSGRVYAEPTAADGLSDAVRVLQDRQSFPLL